MAHQPSTQVYPTPRCTQFTFPLLCKLLKPETASKRVHSPEGHRAGPSIGLGPQLLWVWGDFPKSPTPKCQFASLQKQRRKRSFTPKGGTADVQTVPVAQAVRTATLSSSSPEPLDGMVTHQGLTSSGGWNPSMIWVLKFDPHIHIIYPYHRGFWRTPSNIL